MKIFLGAYACEPNNGSEPEVGWQMVNGIAKVMNNDTIYVVTKQNNKESIEKEGYPLNVKFYYYSPPAWLTFWKKGGRGIRTYYYLWMIGAALFMKKKDIHFDIIHHITFVNDWLPSFFYLLKTKNNRFIWGPIGSHDVINFKFINGNKRKIIENLRIFLQYLFRNFDPSFYISKTRADCIIGINDNVRKKLNLKQSKCFIAEPAIGIKKSTLEKIRMSDSNNNIFTIVSVGRLLYIKNYRLTIRSFSIFLKNNSKATNIKLQIIGNGVDKKSLIELSKDLNIEKNIEFVGKIPLEEVEKYFARANLFLYPTLENAGFVILEAMSHGLPVIAMKYGGPEQFIKNNIEEQLVSATQEYDDIVHSLAKKIDLLYKNRKLALEIGIQNRRDIFENFTWEAKVKKIKNIYTKVLNEI